jgi:GMP synthase PP-ATPase subunit
MEEIYSIDITLVELAFIRQSLDLVSISGKDAHFLSNLQTRIENEMKNIEELKIISSKPPSKK